MFGAHCFVEVSLLDLIKQVNCTNGDVNSLIALRVYVAH